MSHSALSAPRSLLSLLAAALFAGLAATATAADAPGTIRIRAGVSESLKDEAGNVWQADAGFSGGDTIERGAITIKNTAIPSLYRAERYSMSSFTWKLPNGKYTVKLHFCETFEEISGAGQRVFSFNVEGKEFKNFDVTAKAGGTQTAYVETVEVEIADGKLDISFTHQIENPEINGIEIIPAG